MKPPKPRIEPVEILDDGSVVVPLDEANFLQGWRPSSVPIKKDVDESKRVAKAIGAWPQQCWFNARKAILRLPEYAEASYVEGWARTKHMPIEHGWIVRNGVIIDPTLTSENIIYFPGLEFVGRRGIEDFLKTPQGKECKRSPFFYAFGWGGMRCPHFRECYEQAMAALKEGAA